MILHGTSRINQWGHLEIGGCDTVYLAEKYGTPLIVYDEALIRERCRSFIQVLERAGVRYHVAYACKAFCTLAIVQLIDEEGLGLDVVSGGELYTALHAGFPPERIHFHGNNKSKEELEMAVDANIGAVVVDNFHEIDLLESILTFKRKRMNVLLRITPGIHASTHRYIQTGQEDSKFGFDLASGQVEMALDRVLSSQKFHFMGIHMHLGSQIFGEEGFIAAIDKIIQFIEKNESILPINVLNLGGGFGIRYVSEDDPKPLETVLGETVLHVKRSFASRKWPLPELWFEPGRSIVGEAGTTLYRVGSLKRVPGIRNYLAVDGGMSDNLRPALYQAKYEAMLANRANEKNEEEYAVAGKLCESGDILILNARLPHAHSGDLLAVSSTGAYGYSMANNYNRMPRPAVLFVKEGREKLVVRRERYEDLLLNELPLNDSLQQFVHSKE
ncbi:diaminopimelate decarboxylase [Thermicanus aegyptius]|uniref:diaminopimelate decarboxylase n=1 Tax=Thermicanus aegyptius TaxID=94009 RepID=UPI0004266D95|nr:diaminopimelate decarboxylase [Thermicanus aegyptius]